MPKKKSTAKLYDFLDSDKELFKDVVFLVEATHHEQHNFWHDYHYKPKYDGCGIKHWCQESMGRTVQVGEIDNRPVNICIFWAWLNGFKVMFYEPVSQVVDHAMIDAWIEHFSLKTIKWDNEHRWAHTNSNNFHHCIDAVREFTKNKDKRYNPQKDNNRG